MSRKRHNIPSLSTYSWVLTCEHGGNRIPNEWKDRVAIPAEILASHEGVDIGAKELARTLHDSLGWPLFLHEECRLLIESNRSLHHRRLFSRYSKGLLKEEKQRLIDTVYTPYRSAVESDLARRANKKSGVIHISVHSFTPVLNGETRTADIGLLYDSAKPFEAAIARRWRDELLHHGYRIRMNYPYRGSADGFTTHLRKLYPANRYCGIELEVNQKILQSDKKKITAIIVQSLKRLSTS